MVWWKFSTELFRTGVSKSVIDWIYNVSDRPPWCYMPHAI